MQAGDFSAGALQYASDFSFLEALFNASGLSLGLDMLLKTQKDIDKFKEENWDFGDLLDQPLTQKQIDEAQEKIEKLYYGATEAYKKTHGNGSKPTPTPMITEPPAPGVTPPVTVAPINPDDVTMPDDWATMKKNATDKGVLAMGAATAYCVKEAIKGWWDDIVATKISIPDEVEDSQYILDKSLVCPGKSYYINVYQRYNAALDSSWLYFYENAALYNTNDNGFQLIFMGSYSYIVKTWYRDSGEIYEEYAPTHYDITDSNYRSNDSSKIYRYTSNIPIFDNFSDAYRFIYNQHTENKTKLAKSSIWPSTDTKDDYNNNNPLPTPSYPNIAVPSIRLPSLDEIKDLWKQGSDDEENRPTYVTNFITNHTVQPTPKPEPTKKPEVNPNPGGGTDPNPKPSASPTPAVNPDPGGDGGTDPDPNPNPNPDPNPDPDPDNPDPTPEEEASPYKTDLREIFPFCIPFDLIHLLKVFEAEPEAPVFKFPLDIELDNPWTGEKVVDYHHEFELDMSDYEPVIKILRIFLVIFFIVGLMMITRQHMIKG